LVAGLAQLDCDRDRLTLLAAGSEECHIEYAKLLSVHNKLVSLVSPATPTTLRATERSVGGILVNKVAVNKIVGLTLFSLAGFLVFFAVNQLYKTNWASYLTVLFSAGLGAGFYSLTISRSYILQRTYNPQYDLAYYIRYVLGLAAGIILGCLGYDFLKGAQAFAGKGVATAFGPVVLAVVGGYSAEAVSQILQRIAETLVTVIKGSEKKEVERKEQAAQSEASNLVVRTKNDVAKRLQKAVGKAEGEAKGEIQAIIDDLLD